MRKRRLAHGIYADDYGLEARVSWRGTLRSKRFPFGTARLTIRQWQLSAKASLMTADPLGPAGSFAEDARRYLRSPVATRLASFRDREDDVLRWVDIFGDCPRRQVTAEAANPYLEAWATTYAAQTCNHRADALRAIWRVLDKDPHPLPGLRRFPSRTPVRLPPPRHQIACVLSALRPSVTRARLWLLYWTGMRPSQLGRLTPAHFSLESACINVPIGKGGNPVLCPLSPDGVQAARDYIRWQAWGRMSSGSANRLLKVTCIRLNVPRFSVYALRRSFGATLRANGTDLADIQALLGHKRPQTTERYAPVVDLKLRTAVEGLVDAPVCGRDEPTPRK